ncbi:hypothetical protein EV421DRAFT_1729874 [Armillaria borealis]|uniref:Uncharacterized protein n=1 Tax=Armillaria borealis TaxID=47425 RepID=A0AA39N1H8_9AGAR|nr:hypothetical protein EV421DRAFT_1729874 [Armillaria borealis]
MSFLYLGVLTARHGLGRALTEECHFRISSYHYLLDESGGQVSRINIPEELSLMVETRTMHGVVETGPGPGIFEYGTLSWDTQTGRNAGERSGSRDSQWKRSLVQKYLCYWKMGG